MPNFKLQRLYGQFSLILTNFILLFVGINVVLGTGYFVWDRYKTSQVPKEITPPRPGRVSKTGQRSHYQWRWVDLRSYGSIPRPEVDQVLTDFYHFGKVGYRYEPFYQFLPVSFSSKSLNVLQTTDGISFRSNGQTHSRKLAKQDDGIEDVYVLGGSSTFGWNVADTWTIPAFLESRFKEKDSNSRVWNFGMPYYSWYQELILLSTLLKNGHEPETVIFIDGINFGLSQPKFTGDIRERWERQQFNPNASDLPSVVPAFRLINYFLKGAKATAYQQYLDSRYPTKQKPHYKKDYLQTYWMAQALAEKYKFKLLFVWQPHKGFNCNQELYSPPFPDRSKKAIQKVYESMQYLEDDNFLNLSHLCKQNGINKRVFVDDVHYSPQFNAYIASEIYRNLKS